MTLAAGNAVSFISTYDCEVYSFGHHKLSLQQHSTSIPTLVEQIEFPVL